MLSQDGGGVKGQILRIRAAIWAVMGLDREHFVCFVMRIDRA